MSTDIINLTTEQIKVIEQPLLGKTFLHGPAGTGKTSTGVERLIHLLQAGIPGDEILVIVPQRTLAEPYFSALRSPEIDAGSLVSILTIGGLARRMVKLFWPIAADQTGFSNPEQPPTFLTLETAQYFMAHLVRPMLEQGYFEGVTIERNRLYSQIIDNLNKAALVGLDHTEIGEYLKNAWTGDPGQVHIYEDAQHCANLFRDYCFKNNLLDYSLQLELFFNHVWPTPLCQAYLQHQYHHLIIDNLEEDVPKTYDLLKNWLKYFSSALIIFDEGAGFRRLLGADPATTKGLISYCDHDIKFSKSFSISDDIKTLGNVLLSIQSPETNRVPENCIGALNALELPREKIRYYPEMLDWVSNEIEVLIENGIPPEEIVVLAPYFSDSLRFSLIERLNEMAIPYYSHRPSRSLREEPAAQSLLTLAALAHPDWGVKPTKFDVATMFLQVISEMDLVRAQLLSEIVFQSQKCKLTSFEQIITNNQERITYMLGERYEILRTWIDDYAQGAPAELDHFLSRLFGEVLSQPGFSFHDDRDSGEVTAQLIESVRKFRWIASTHLSTDAIPLGQEYLHMVNDGVIAAQYLFSWQEPTEGAVMLAPASTFLMRNRPVSYQFWLDIGSRGWYERIRQPLTHPFVLSRQWEKNQPWTDEEEYSYSQQTLFRLTRGLLRRCKQRVYLGLSELGEGGYEQKGMLLKNFDRVLRTIYQSG
ncbi:MAG: UvrD-helicase domain-containing protein, partial [Chloroflexota bacterium]